MKKNPPKKQTKPRAKLIGADSNVFNLLAIASRALKDADRHDDATEMSSRVMASSSFDEALAIITEYVEPY